MADDLEDLILIQRGWTTEVEKEILYAAKERIARKATLIMLKREREILDQRIKRREG